MAGRSNFWEHQLVAGVAFHPRKCRANTNQSPMGGGWMDDVVTVGDGTQIAVRLYMAPSRDQGAETDRRPVLWYMHANAELCTDMETEVGLFYDCGFRAVLCPEFRGYAWSTGKPSMTKICPDAQAIFEATPQILTKAGLQDIDGVPVVVSGRSLGAACAVHVAFTNPDHVAGMVLESGCISLLALPMVQEIGMMMPDMLRALESVPEPPNTVEKVSQVTVPSMFIHGERDEMVPIEQAIAAHEACGCTYKKLVKLRRSGHNDVRLTAGAEYRTELRLMADIASGACLPEELLRSPPPSPGMFAILARGLRCVPGMRRCLAERDEEASVAVESQPPSDTHQ